MSSAISTRTREPIGLDPDPEPESLQAWQLFTLAGLIGATIVVFVSRGHTPAGIILLSLTIFAAALVGVAAWRTFAPLAGAAETGGAQMLAGRTRAALEREKTLVLRSIKELEFDFAMKKVSEKDFAEMSARLRLRAAGLMRQLDASTTYRETIRTEIERRIGAAPVRSTTPSGVTPAVGPSCAAETDGDARFCKHCGASLESTE
jgi:hypothetical protein